MTFEEHIEATLERVLERRLRPIEEALRRLQPGGENDLLDVDQAAQLIGYSPRTVRARFKAGTLPGFKPKDSSEWRARRGDLLRAMGSEVGVDLEAEARKIASGG